MGAYVIGVVRSARSLDTLNLETREPADRASPWRVDHVCELRPLAANSRAELWTAWRALESVTTWDETTLEHVLTVLRATVPCADTPENLPALGPEVHAAPEPRATAAHPRAFRGTKHRPPRPEQPDAVDVRPYLLTRRHIDQILELLGQPRGTDPYVAWNHRVDATANFDPMFVMHLLPLFKECAWSDIGAFASLARSLHLHRHPELRSALTSVFLAANDPARALGWWNHVLAHDPEQRLEAAKLVATTGAAKLPPVEPSVGALLLSLPLVQQWSFYRGLVGGASPTYLESGLQLGALSRTKIDEPPPGRVDVAALIETTIERLDKAMEEDSGAEFWRPHLWRLCGYQPELIALLSSQIFTSLQPEAAFWVIRIASTPRWSPETAEKEWKALAPTIPLLAEFAARLSPEYQRKFVEDMGDVYLWAVSNDHSVTDALAKCVDLCFRVAKAPFGTKAVLGELLPCLALVYEDGAQSWNDRKAVRDAPDSSWLALEDACKRYNQVRLLGRGLNRFGQFAAKLMVSSFATSPGPLLETADLLASISFESGESVLKEYGRSPLADPGLADAPIDRLCELIAPIAQSGGPNPVRRALRLHMSGEEKLSDAQVSGHQERIVADLDIIRLAAIRQAIERILAARVGLQKIETPTVRHAAAMLNNVDVHRRQLRRMLTATLAGDSEWKLRHPRTNEWFTRHPKLDRKLWIAGIETCGQIEGIGEIRIAIESDPLEALKLGTYVGSCLGRGGNLEYSAAAVVLDANKQVVYARDKRGSVVGRQLLAISEADELVCFGVYGAAKIDALEPLFREYDRAFASTLGLPLFGSSTSSKEYEIATILSREWWDDTAWTENLQ
ncbi:MAG TPA: hypothetical protein VMJ10_33290 [Kofleriaceae bacterium]|nr:hypothetical protein [Kofleriaceae bacterium]